MNNASILSLNGVWRLRAADETEFIPCPVPGDNYSALQAAGRIPDPYWRRNELAVQSSGLYDGDCVLHEEV